MPATLAQLHAFAQGGASHASMCRGMNFIRESWVSRLEAITERASQAANPNEYERSLASIGRVCELESERIRALGEPDDSWMETLGDSFDRFEDAAGSLLSELHSRSVSAASPRTSMAETPLRAQSFSETQALASLAFGSILTFGNILEQQARLNTALKHGESQFDSIVHPAASVSALVHETAEQISKDCQRDHGVAPVISIEEPTIRAWCTCVPSQLSSALGAILNNAAAATLASRKKLAVSAIAGAAGGQSAVSPHEALPAIVVSASGARGVLAIRVTDRAGGMDPETARRAFEWGWSISAPRADVFSESPFKDDSREAVRSPRALVSGIGAGLPLAQLHARYMGGHVTLCPEPGLGTDAFLTVANDGRGDNDSLV